MSPRMCDGIVVAVFGLTVRVLIPRLRILQTSTHRVWSGGGLVIIGRSAQAQVLQVPQVGKRLFVHFELVVIGAGQVLDSD